MGTFFGNSISQHSQEVEKVNAYTNKIQPMLLHNFFRQFFSFSFVGKWHDSYLSYIMRRPPRRDNMKNTIFPSFSSTNESQRTYWLSVCAHIRTMVYFSLQQHTCMLSFHMDIFFRPLPEKKKNLLLREMAFRIRFAKVVFRE